METVSNRVPQLQTGCAQHYVAIAVSITLNDWGKLNRVLKDLTDWLNHNGVKIAGPLFYRYFNLGSSEEVLDMEVGYPIATQIPGNGLIVTGIIPKGTYATLIHCGHPHTIDASFEIMQCWARQQGIQWKYYQPNGKQVWAGRFHFHLANPKDVTDQSQCRMALAVLIDEQTSG
jgi:effector-binding domain-containing protein